MEEDLPCPGQVVKGTRDVTWRDEHKFGPDQHFVERSRVRRASRLTARPSNWSGAPTFGDRANYRQARTDRSTIVFMSPSRRRKDVLLLDAVQDAAEKFKRDMPVHEMVRRIWETLPPDQQERLTLDLKASVYGRGNAGPLEMFERFVRDQKADPPERHPWETPVGVPGSGKRR